MARGRVGGVSLLARFDIVAAALGPFSDLLWWKSRHEFSPSSCSEKEQRQKTKKIERSGKREAQIVLGKIEQLGLNASRLNINRGFYKRKLLLRI